MQNSEILTAAKEMIKDPVNWHQGEWESTKEGKSCYCALGAVARVINAQWYSDVLGHPVAQMLKEAVPEEFYKDSGYNDSATFAPFNDNSSHTEVMAAFDKAITVAVKQETQQANAA